MDVMTTYLPAGLWVMAAATTIIILLIFFGYYIYQRNRMAALVKDARNAAELAAQVEILEARKKELAQWHQTQQAELERLTAERQEQEILRAELQRIEQECAMKDQENQALRSEVGELENQRHLTSQTLERLGKDIKDLEGKKIETEAINERYKNAKNQLHEVSEQLNQQKNNLDDTSQKLSEKKVSFISLSNQMDKAEAKLQDLEEQVRKAKLEAENVEEIVNETNRAKVELHNTRKEWADLKVLVESLHVKESELENSIAKLKELEKNSRTKMKELVELNNELEGKRKELDAQRSYMSELEVKIFALNFEKKSLEEEIKKLGLQVKPDEKNIGDEKIPHKLIPYTDLLIKNPDCLLEDTFNESRSEVDEILALDEFKDRLKNDGLFFSSRIIDAFHTSLKCHDINPLTVLAGVSGTGKTLLPYYYAKVMGMHSLVMAVQPRWDSPQDMFGFYNYLEKQYKATDLSRALIRMDPYNYLSDDFDMLNSEWAKERMLLVLLDEMNLARTEYYFSEFLSKLELRRMVKDKHEKSDRAQAEIELDAGPGAASLFNIWVDANVLFVGTMNEDETTQTLSDKVLDRANVLRFGKPDESNRPADDATVQSSWPKSYLKLDDWKGWQKNYDVNTPWYQNVVEWTNEVNSALDRVGRPFGYRVQRAIGTYVANYPRVEEEERQKLAFADQVEQKIIPKLRGIDLGDTSTNQCLEKIEDIISTTGDDELGVAFRNSIEESQSVGMFQWRGVTRREG